MFLIVLLKQNIFISKFCISQHYAARGGYLEIVGLLLSNGADIMAKTKASLSTPLHRAATTNHHEVVCLLLRHNADPCCQDVDGKTPLHLVCLLITSK